MNHPLRLSSYTIPVKLENEQDKYMLIHGYTGSIDVVSEKLFRRIKDPSPDDFSDDLYQSLLNRGYITTKTKEEEYEYVARIARALTRGSKMLYSVFTWVVTYNCNFRCPYCFEGREKKDSCHKIAFTKEQVDVAYAAMELIQPRKELRKKTITLYGGEPLLAENRDVVFYIVEEGKQRGYNFMAVTNGYELEYFTDLFSSDGIYKLQITVDGPKNIHDQRRIHYKDHDTFDKILSNIQLALDKGIEVVVRTNVDHKNIHLFTELKHLFEDKGYYTYPKFDYYYSILDDNEHIEISERKDIEFISPCSFLEKIDKQDSQLKNYDIYKLIQSAMIKKKPIAFRSVSCAAQVNGFVFDSNGYIYPCWETIGDEKYIEGKYSNKEIIWNKRVLSMWKEIDVSQRIKCSHCKFALLCGGGCPYHYLLDKDLNCALFRKTFSMIVNSVYSDIINN